MKKASASDSKKIRNQLIKMLTDPNKSKTGKALSHNEAIWLIESYEDFSQQELADLIGGGNLRAAEVFIQLAKAI